tara:strand:+ start:246 stop:518 length:273 start_codon:yes stop_codon:yes gene_type:complete
MTLLKNSVPSRASSKRSGNQQTTAGHSLSKITADFKMKYTIPIIIALFAGCASNKVEEEHLLYIADDYAYKSVTQKDYTIKEECHEIHTL